MYANYVLSSPVKTDAQKVLSQTFVMVGVMMAIMSFVAFATKSIALPIWLHIGVIITSFILLFVIEKQKNTAFGLIGLLVFAALDGVSTGPLLNHYLKMKNGIDVIVLSTLTTSAIAFGCSIYAITTKKDFSFMRGFLLMATIGLLVAMIINLFLGLAIMTMIIAVLGVLVFSAWMLFDVSSIVRGEQNNYISAALGIFLNLKNILQFVLQIFGINLGNDD